MAQAVDQGVLPHLLAANRAAAWRSDQRAPLLGLVPGLLLTPRDGADAPHIEVDLFAVKGGRPIVGECKAGGDRIGEEVVDRFGDLGRRLGCSRIVYATATDFAADAAALEHARGASDPAAVERWEAGDLFDLRHPGHGQTDAAEYLAQALRLVR